MTAINNLTLKNFLGFNIKATHTGEKAPMHWDEKYDRTEAHHVITVKNLETKKSCKFDYWMSVAQPQIKSTTDIKFAMYCFVSDALSGDMDFEDFCGEFGYDTDSIKAMKIHKACIRNMKKLQRIFPGDIYDLMNDLQDYA